MRWSLLRVATVAMTAAFGMFAVNVVTPVVPWMLVWLPSCVCMLVLVVDIRRTARTPTLPDVVARFWRHCFLVSLFVAGGHVAGGHVAEAVDASTAADLSGMHLTPGQVAMHGTAVLLLLYALMRLPFGKQSRSEMIRVVLDAGTAPLAGRHRRTPVPRHGRHAGAVPVRPAGHPAPAPRRLRSAPRLPAAAAAHLQPAAVCRGGRRRRPGDRGDLAR